jgi:uncharacterized protein (TIGR00297 family)
MDLVPAENDLSRHLAGSITVGLAISVVVAALAWRRGSLSTSGATAAVVVGTIIYAAGGPGWFAALGAFFVTSTLLGRVGRARKAAVKREFDKGDTRDAWQVLANGGAATLAALAMAWSPSPRWADAFVAGLACANADTWATELGVLSPGDPWSLLRGRRVPRGTSGAVSPLGLGAAFAGALLIGLVAACSSPRPLHTIAVALGLGFAGALADSFLGATLQERWHCPSCVRDSESPRHHCGTDGFPAGGVAGFGNDAVNAASTLLAALAAALL